MVGSCPYILLVTALLAGCDDEVLSLQWRYTFDEEALAARAVGVEGRILRGGCDSDEEVYRVELRVDEEPRGELPPRLEAERFGFHLVARDTSCLEFAAGCEDVDLSNTASVLVTLSATAESELCPPEECDDGSCGGPECPAEVCNGFDDDCDGEVDEDFDLSVDPDNCGSCGVACDAPRAVTRCTGGVCEVESCESGWGDCSGGATDGCETELNTLSDCGECDTPCAPANARGDCSSGTCAIGVCDRGWGDCSGGAADGCETNTEANEDHCGECDRGCEFGDVCSSGLCCMDDCECEQSCTEGVDCVCEGGCECLLDCVDDTCRPECHDAGTLCRVNAVALSNFGPFSCNRGATCVVDAEGASNVEDITCSGGSTSCEINCESGSNCLVTCNGGAECLLRCAGRSNCEFQPCAGAERTCAGSIIVCNRDCP